MNEELEKAKEELDRFLKDNPWLSELPRLKDVASYRLGR